MSFQKIESSPARFNAIELDELKSRFKKLQYDYNKSTTDLRREIKDMVDSKFYEIQFKFLKGAVKDRKNLLKQNTDGSGIGASSESKA